MAVVALRAGAVRIVLFLLWAFRFTDAVFRFTVLRLEATALRDLSEVRMLLRLIDSPRLASLRLTVEALF